MGLDAGDQLLCIVVTARVGRTGMGDGFGDPAATG